MPKILVRADDLGYSEAVNYGLAKAVKDGIIRSVGVMPNMPEAAHGIALLEGVEVCYGQHTNICTGHPLTDPALIPSLCQPNGEFKTAKEYRDAFAVKTDFVVLDEVLLEIEAQYQRFVELTGRQPSYFEGHAVPSPTFFKALEMVAQQHGLDYLGMNFNGPTKFRNTLLYSSMDSMNKDYQPFESLKRAALQDYGPDGCCMFVCHPGYVDDFLLRTSFITVQRAQEVAMSCDSETKQWLAEHDIQVVTYDELP